jgi:hypothetical protein
MTLPWMTPAKPISIDEAINRIVKLNSELADFWGNSAGWASIEAAGLLAKSKLDWQVSLSKTLSLWIANHELTPGELILAWANLGSLVEGTLKTFLSVWYRDYISDIEGLKKANAYHHTKKEPKEPDGLTLGPLFQYFAHKKLLTAKSLALIELAHKRRNVIHAFQDKEIGNAADFRNAVFAYLDLVREVNLGLPYPGGVFEPREV